MTEPAYMEGITDKLDRSAIMLGVNRARVATGRRRVSIEPYSAEEFAEELAHTYPVDAYHQRLAMRAFLHERGDKRRAEAVLAVAHENITWQEFVRRNPNWLEEAAPGDPERQHQIAEMMPQFTGQLQTEGQ